jgi:hypothetical protein
MYSSAFDVSQIFQANSDGWTDIEGCGLCIEKYQRSIRAFNDCMRPANCQCIICTRQPPSLRDSASHILFNCVLDLERFNLTCYTTYSQYKFAAGSGRVDELSLLPPRFPVVEVRFRFLTFEERFHLHCPGRGYWNTRMEGVFGDIKSTIALLIKHESFYW